MSTYDYHRAFFVRRGVGNQTKDSELAFVRGLEDIAEDLGVSLYARLGMSAVELVRRAEIVALQDEHAELTRDRVKRVLKSFKRRKMPELGEYKTLTITGTDLFEVENGVVWLGARMSEESEEELAGERADVSEVLSVAAGEEIILPGRELFLNIGMVDENAEAAAPVLEYVAQKLPDRLFVYDVDLF